MVQYVVYLVKKSFKQEFGFVLAMPAVIWQICFLLLPALVLFWRSLFTIDSWGVTLANYVSCTGATYAAAIYNSLVLAYLTALACLLFCLPLALVINFHIKRELRTAVLLFLMMPSWTNFIIRIYSWFFLLRNDGMLFRILQGLGLLNAGSSLLANQVVTIVVMVYCYFPYMLLPIYNCISNINPRILEASGDLGASSWQTFWRVILPLSIKGIGSGWLVVTLVSFGEFAVPELIGGGKYAYWGNLVVNNFLLLSDYNAGSAVIFFGILVILASLLLIYAALKLLLLVLSHFVTIPQKLLRLNFAD